MIHPLTAQALIQARQDDIQRMVNDPAWMARQQGRYDEPEPRAESARHSRRSSVVRRRLSAYLGARTASRIA